MGMLLYLDPSVYTLGRLYHSSNTNVFTAIVVVLTFQSNQQIVYSYIICCS
jgi:hypothetical protein